MSALRIAAVTHVLKDLLNDGLINMDITATLGTAVTVTSLSPRQIDANSESATQLNLFLYRVSSNTGWNNLGYPSRNGRGQRINNPPLALNLHYLLTAFGSNELDTEILLGYGMQLFHETPVLSRNAINTSLTSANANNALPQHLREIVNSNLGNQFEQIKITPEPTNSEEISRLWTAFQTGYRPCTAYTATVVLIESEQSTRPALPVQQPQIFALPFKNPVIEKILSQEANVNTNPIQEHRRIVMGDRIVIRGHGLNSENAFIRLNGIDIAVNASNIADTEVSFILDHPPVENLRAGVQAIQALLPITLEQVPELEEDNGNLVINQRQSIQRGEVSSNVLAFVLSPTLTITDDSAAPADSNFDLTLQVTVNPPIQEGQRVVLFLNQINAGENPQAYSQVFPTDGIVPTNTLTMNINNVEEGDYLIRIQVDGAESPLATDTNGSFISPSITVP